MAIHNLYAFMHIYSYKLNKQFEDIFLDLNFQGKSMNERENSLRISWSCIVRVTMINNELNK